MMHHVVGCCVKGLSISWIGTYILTILSTKDDLRPHRPPPLPLSAPSWRRRHCCHGCHVVAAIAAIAIAAATATAAAIFAATSTVSADIATTFWLIVVRPCAASASTTIACPRRCRCWLLMPLPLLPQPQTTAPCSFRRNHCLCFNNCCLLVDVQNITQTK